MNDVQTARALPALLATAIGCATPSSWDLPLRKGAQHPQTLQRQAELALQSGDLEAAYWRLAEIEQRHPESEESRDLFPVAASLFKKAWWKNRYVQPDSVWLTTQPGFMYQWLARFFDDEFPQAQMEALFIGMPMGFYRDFATFGASRPEIAQWTLHVERDNGIIQSIAAEQDERRAR